MLQVGVLKPRRFAGTTHPPTRATLDGADDVALIDWIGDTPTTIHHPAGACRMSAKDAVLELGLPVRGTARLRVLDDPAASEIVSGRIDTPTATSGEKPCGMILQAAREQGGRREKRAIASGFEGGGFPAV